MALLLALFLVVHGGVHIGYLCGGDWPFSAEAPWLVTWLGVAAERVEAAGIVLALVTFFGFLVAAIAAIGLLPARLWRPSIVVAAAASAVMLVLFVTPWTVPGIVIDAALLWAVVVWDWRPARLIGRRMTSRRPLAR